MKKVALSLAGVLAAAAFAPEASALPVFARQTGMACNACHFNHFPLLNGFGRSFKSSGFTLMGAQGKVEGDNLSLPDRLNMAVLTTAGYESISNRTNGVTPVAGPAPSGAWYLPGSGGELSLFFGGKISDNAGFLSELGVAGAGAAVGAVKMPMMFDVGAAKVGLVLDTNGGQGVAHSFELLNTGAVNVHKIVSRGHETVYSAAQWLGTNNASSGASIVAQMDGVGFVNVSKWEAAAVGLGAGATSLPLTYIRAAYVGDIAGFDVGFGVQNWSGTTTGAQFGLNAAQLNVTPAAGLITPGTYKATVVDAQMQGELGGFSTGLYASYGTAPAGSTFGANAAGLQSASSLNFGADVELAHGVTGKFAFRNGKNGAGLSDNALQIAGSYQLAQNLELGLIHTSNSGNAWNGAVPGKSVTTLIMEALF